MSFKKWSIKFIGPQKVVIIFFSRVNSHCLLGKVDEIYYTALQPLYDQLTVKILIDNRSQSFGVVTLIIKMYH